MMKLEHLPDARVIRIYDFSPVEGQQLLAAIETLANGAVAQVPVHELPCVQSVAGCRLTLRVRSWDQAIICVRQPAEFECGFTTGTWDNVAALTEPFTQAANGYQWLAGVPGEASLLISVDGQW
jgi:hypothetical protein